MSGIAAKTTAGDGQNGVAVKITGLRKTFGKGDAAVQALRGIDLEVRAGELMMLRNNWQNNWRAGVTVKCGF